jgi:hypothetical protein
MDLRPREAAPGFNLLGWLPRPWHWKRMQSVAGCVCAWLICCSFVRHAPAQEPSTEPSAAAVETAVETAAETAQPLHARIDALLASESPLLTAPPAEEGLLLRKLSLDLRGVVPTAAELQEYLADADPERWQRAVRRFLQDPLHQEHLADWIDKTLMQRRGFGQVDRNAWNAWLRERVAEGARIDVVLMQVLKAPWWHNNQRPALRFFLDRSGDPHLITRDLGRVLLGRDMQCAQCHDHPLVDDYRQVDYHGLLAFVSASSMTEITYKDDKGADQKVQLYVERPGADAPFESVFDKGVLIRSGPRLVSTGELFEPYQLPDERLEESVRAETLGNAPAAPKLGRRELLATQLAGPNAHLVARNFANRLWAVAFGQGLVHPLDMHHPDNPPSHPGLLDLLADGLVESQFDADRFLEQLMLTDAYRRGGQLPALPWPVAADAVSAGTLSTAAPATADWLALAAQVATQIDSLTAGKEAAKAECKAAEAVLETARDAWRAVQVERNTLRAELDKAEAAYNDLKKKDGEAAAARDAAVKKHQDAAARVALLDEALAKFQQAAQLAPAEDAELTQAAATTQAKVDAVRGELEGLAQGAAAATAAADMAAVALDGARDTIHAAVAKLAELEKSVQERDQAYVAARNVWGQRQADELHHRQRLEQAEHILALAAAIQQAQAAAEKRTAAEVEVTDQAALLAAAREAAQTAEQQLLAAQTQRESAAAGVQGVEQQHAAHVAQLTQLRQTQEQLTATLSLVAEPENLQAALKTIEETLAAKSAATAEFDVRLTAAQQSLDAALALVGEREQRLAAMQATIAERDSALAAARSRAEQETVALEEAVQAAQRSWDRVSEDCERLVAVARLRPLSPEQLGLSILRATGVLDNYIQAELAEIAKNEPLPEDADDAARQARQQRAVRGAVDKLRGNVDVFANLYASGIGQTADEFFASPDQALFMANGGSVFTWAGPSGSNVTQRVIAHADDFPAAARELILSLLSREPTERETEFIASQLQAAGESRAAVAQELVWAVLTGAEFRFYR